MAAVFNSTVVLLLFRNIQFTTAITLALYTGVLHLAALSGHLMPPPTMPDGGFVYLDLFGWAYDHPFWSALCATLLVFIQALIVNGLADHFRLMNDRNWLPGMAFSLLASALPDFQFLSPPLVAATFLGLAIWRVFQTYKSPKSAVLVFDAAFWLTVSSLFYPKSLLLIVAIFFSIGLMRSWNLRDGIAFIAGIIVPIFLGWLWYFWADQGSAFRAQHLGELFGWQRFDLVLDTMTVVKGAFLALLLLVFILNFGTFSRNKSMVGQKCVGVLYWMLFVGAGTVLLRPDWRWEAFALMAMPSGIFLAMTLQNLRSYFAEIMHLVVLGIVLFLQYLPQLL